ncbi:MAG: arsenate reductase ArsC [Bdellovibrionota bacterium]
MKVLFMCVANSARSQLAEGLAKSIFPKGTEIESAGSKPGNVNPLAIVVMQEEGIDLFSHHSKSVEDLDPIFVNGLDYVITLCAEEVCPIVNSPAKKLHWPMPDPAGHKDLTYEERLELFRKTRNAIKAKLIAFKSEIRK